MFSILNKIPNKKHLPKMASQKGVPGQKFFIIWVKVEMENKTRENDKKKSIVDPNISLVIGVNGILISESSKQLIGRS